MTNDVPGNPNNPNNFPVIPGNTLEQTMPVFGDLALFPSIKKIYQKYFPNLDLSSGDYKEFNLERDKLPPEQQQAFMTELLADPMVQGAMSAPKSTVSVGPDAQVSSIGGLAPDEIPDEERTPENNYGCPVGYVRDPVSDACVSVRGEDPASDPIPGDKYDPLGQQPGPFEQEDIDAARDREDKIKDMREGNLNPYTLTDEELEFLTRGSGATREQLAEMFDYEKPAEDPVGDDDDAVDEEGWTAQTIQDIRDGELNPYEMTDEELSDVGLTRAQAEAIYGGELSEEEQDRFREGLIGDYNSDETRRRNIDGIVDVFEGVFGEDQYDITKDPNVEAFPEGQNPAEIMEGRWRPIMMIDPTSKSNPPARYPEGMGTKYQVKDKNGNPLWRKEASDISPEIDQSKPGWNNVQESPPWLKSIEEALGIPPKWVRDSDPDWMTNRNPNFPPPLTDENGNILPGVTITYNVKEKKWTAKVLIAVPGLPKWVQGKGFEVEIGRDGEFVLGEKLQDKFKEIGEKIKNIPKEVADGIQKTIDGITAQGNSVRDVDIDKDGNVTGTILDSAGNVLDKLFIPANALLEGGVDSPGLLDFILKNRLLAGALDFIGSDYVDFLKVKKKGDGPDGSPPADTQPPDSSGGGSPIQGTGEKKEDEEKDPLDDEESEADERPSDGERPPEERPPDGERPTGERPPDGERPSDGERPPDGERPTTSEEEPALREGTLDELERTSDGIVTSTDRPATGGDRPATGGDRPATGSDGVVRSGDNPVATSSQPLMNAFMGLGVPGGSLFGDTAKEGDDLEYFFDIGGDTIFAGKNFSNAEKRGIGALAKQSKELENLQRMVTPITGVRLPDRSKAARGGMVKNTFMDKLNDIMRYR